MPKSLQFGTQVVKDACRVLLVVTLVVPAFAQTAVNPDAAIVEVFKQRVADYVKLHVKAEGTLEALKKPTESTVKMRHHEHALRKAIVAERPKARPGNIFTPQICGEFRRLVAIAYQAEAKHIRASLANAEPGTWDVRVQVNGEYPDNRPLQSMPPSLLLNLPPLPQELEYRIVGRSLVLRDIGANLVVDVIPGVIPK